jgi:hypothetical protein
MLITFQSGVCADVLMFGDVAYQMMELMGKEAGQRGVVTVEQLPEAIARLRQALEADREARRQPPPEQEGEERPEKVSVTQRALPLIELLECSLRKKKPVTWGV